MRRTWVQDPETGELIEKDKFSEAQGETPTIVRDIEAFVSPVTGEIISSRSQLRRHNKKHGVTDSRDYSPEYLGKTNAIRREEAEKTAHKERINTLRRAYERQRK